MTSSRESDTWVTHYMGDTFPHHPVDNPPLYPYLFIRRYFGCSDFHQASMSVMDTPPLLRLISHTRTMHTRGTLAVLIIAATLAPPTLNGKVEVSNPAFRRISTDDGLSQSVVLCMLQDRRGFMWFGTEDGLNRYDGYSFVTYRHNPHDKNSLSNSYVWSLHEDREGLLWIGTWGGGLSCFDPARNSFVQYQHVPADTTSVSHERVTALCEDSLGSLWACTAGGGLNRFDRAARRFVRMPHLFDSLPAPRRDAMFCMLTDRSGVIWIGTYFAGLLAYDPRLGIVRDFRHDPKDSSSLSDDRITGLCEAGNGDLWVGTWGGGLNLLRTAARTFEHFRNNPRDSTSIPGDIIRSLYRDSKGNLWIGTMGAGAARYNSTSRSFARFRHSPFVPNSLSDDVVTSLYADDGGVLWFGTANGISVNSPYVQKFPRYTRDIRNPQALSGKRVFAMCQDSLGFVWIGTEDAGLNRFDPRSGSFRHYRFDPADTTSLPHDYVAALMTDHHGDIWVGTYGGGFARFDRTRQRFHRFVVNPSNPSRRFNAYISALAEDRQGNIWVGTWIAGMLVMNRSGKVLRSFVFDKDNPNSLPDNDVRCIFPDRSGAVWVGTARGGIARLDSLSGAFLRYRNGNRNPGGLSDDYVQTVFEDRIGNLWAGTFGDGLCKLNRGTSEWTHFTVQDGLPNNVVYSILEDPSGKLWLSTNNGITCFDPEQAAFRNYTRHDGLQADEFNFNASCTGPDGTLYFGGINGFNVIMPGPIMQNPHIPPIAITGFNVFNAPVPVDSARLAEAGITLDHTKNFFSFEYAALDYSLPARNTYAYMLEGVDKSWVHAGTRRLAGYTDLSPGHYVFRVKGANNDGVWNEAGVSLAITITPPFWQTLWFRVLGVLLSLGVIVAAYRMRIASILKVERMRLSIASDLHDDIGSSLASIAVLADLVRNRMAVPPAAAGHLLDISRAARTTSESLRDIVWFINPEHDTTGNILDHLQGISSKMLAGMEYAFKRDDHSATTRLPMAFRRDVVLVFKEILSNIVRHAEAGRVEICVGTDSGRFHLVISDNGKGFDAAIPPPGNGLSTMRRRAQQLDGTIDVRSSPGKGTTVTLNAKIP
jgi:ligand-binding sensor domain-containing protein